MSKAHTGPLGHPDVMGMTRRTLLGSAVAVAAAAITSPAAHAAEVPSLWREFRANPYAHPQIPFIGRAGTEAAAAASPATVSSPTSATSVPGPTARPTRPPPSTGPSNARCSGRRHRSAPAGTYRIDDVIRVGHDNVVLRGAGSGRTTLVAHRHLQD